ncbi:hypothetical protein L210DRAFT_3511577 [Boletus edulis BED1]|uniref:Uncharacterized protein n=1 Tax=Boletus edulis BED1 TaxID=1328754 RepID=A0AAD4BB60_BOLED|nr:hypothetical protein L210DRAFT_3511577 [Boletus edulis BED1]
MSTSTTEIANAVMICKKGHVRYSIHQAVCSFEEGFGAEMTGIAQATYSVLADVDPERLTRDRRPAPPMLTTYLQAVSPSLSAPPSPDLSSFPSQSWTIIANVDIEHISTPVMICDDEDLSGMDYAQRLGVPTTPTDSCGPPTLGSSSSTQSPSPTVAKASDDDLSGTNVDIEQISTPVTICGDEDLSGMDYAQRLGVPTTPTDSCGLPMLGSSSPTQLPSLTVAEASDEDLSGMDYAQRSGVPTTPTDSCGPPTLGSSSHPQLSSLTVVGPSPQTDLSTVTPRVDSPRQRYGQ